MKYNKIGASIKWSMIERLLTQAAQLAISIIFARFLGPSDFGVISILVLLTSISQTLVDSGFSSALIRQRRVTQKQLSTIFYFNLAISILIYILLFCFANFMGSYLNLLTLPMLIKVGGIVIIVNALNIIPRTRLTISYDFKTQSIVSIISVLLGALFSIPLLLNGYGYWSVVINMLVISISTVVIFYIVVPWSPSLSISILYIKKTSSFSFNLLFASLLNTVFDNVYQVILAKNYSSSHVGFFTQSKTLTLTPANTISSIIQRVTYRYFSELYKNKNLKHAFLESIKLTAFITFPLFITFSYHATEIIPFLLGDAWEESIPLISILAISFMLYPVHSLYLNILNVVGRSDLFLKLEIYKKILTVLVLIISINFGVVGICYGILVVVLLSTFINAYHTVKILQLGFMEQVNKIVPYVFFGFIANTLSGLIIQNNDKILMFLSIFLSFFLYFGMVLVFMKSIRKYLKLFILRDK